MKNFSIAKSRRLRSTPYTSRIEKQGVTAYTVYNHMLLPAAFGSIEESYEIGKKFANMVDKSTTHIIDGCGHMIMIEKAFEMREKVLEFLQK